MKTKYAIYQIQVGEKGDEFIRSWWTGKGWSGLKAWNVQTWTEKTALKYFEVAKRFSGGNYKIVMRERGNN